MKCEYHWSKDVLLFTHQFHISVYVYYLRLPFQFTVHGFYFPLHLLHHVHKITRIEIVRQNIYSTVIKMLDSFSTIRSHSNTKIIYHSTKFPFIPTFDFKKSLKCRGKVVSTVETFQCWSAKTLSIAVFQSFSQLLFPRVYILEIFLF